MTDAEFTAFQAFARAGQEGAEAVSYPAVPVPQLQDLPLSLHSRAVRSRIREIEILTPAWPRRRVRLPIAHSDRREFECASP